MGRPELPVDAAAGPVSRLAHDLRELRRAAGNMSYRAMAKKADFSVTTLAKAASGERLPSLAVLRAYVQACGEEDPTPWEARWAEAEALAEEERQEDSGAAPPYRGLARFEPGDRELFFGRDRMVDELRELACGSPFAVVFGASGSGKSSLLRAGLIPLLRERIAREGREAVLRILTPGARPATTYGHLLSPEADDPECWVVVDQFEEVFTLCRDRAERDRFLDLLLAARDPGSRLRVLVAVRSDFYARCAEHPRLAEALHSSGLLVRPMTADELREAVIGPAQAARLIVEKTLTARIVEDVIDEPGGLPMLSHALLETWRRRKGRMLTLAAYEAAGGVRGAIAASAEEAYGELSPAQAHAARHLLLRMVEPGQGNADTRRPLTREEMAGWEDPEVRSVAGRLTRARLLTTDDDGVQLAHEALITCWPRLREWIDADRERLRHHRQLTDAARTWLQHDRDPGTLYRGTRLARAEELFAGEARDYDGLTSEETAFLVTAAEQRASEERAATRARRRSRTLVASLCAVLAVALVVGLTAVRLRQDSEQQTTDAAARRVAAVADALRTTDPRTAMLLGVAAWRISPLPDSRRALLGALSQRELGNFTDPAPGDTPERYLDVSGRTLLSISDGTWQTWEVGTHRRIASGPVPHGAVLAAAPGGRVLLLQTAQQTQRLWDTRTRRWIGDPLPFRDTVTFGASGHNYLVREPHDDRAGLYSLTDGHLVFRTPSAGRGELSHAAADDRLLAVCPRGRTPQVWDTSAHSVRSGAWTGARGVCGDDAFLGLAGGRLLALAGGRVRVWDTTSGRQLADVAHPGVLSTAVSADGSFLATGGGQEIRVWRLPNGGAPVFRHSLDNESLSGLAWDSSRPQLRYLEGGTVHTLDLTTTLTRAWRKSPLAGVRLSPDGRTLATAERIGDRYVFQLRNTRDGRLLRTLPDPSRPVFRTGTPTVPADVTEPLLSFSPDGGTFAYGVSARGWGPVPQRLTVWDVAAGRAKTTVDLATASALPPEAIALGPGGRTLLTARLTDDGYVNETWDTTRRRRTALLPGPAGRHLAVSPDGGLLVTDNRVVRAGRSHTHDLVQHDGIGAIAFAPDGSGLAAGDWTGRVAVWDGDLRHRAGILRNVFLAPVDPSSDSAEAIRALAFSPDGSTLAVGGDSGTVQLWDIATQQPLGPSLPTPGGSVDTLAFSPDSTTLYAGGKHVPLQRYVVDPDRAVSLVCARAGKAELTRAQWHTYVPDQPYRRVCP